MTGAAELRRPGAYGWYVVTLLALINAVNYTDRLALSVLAEPIKRDLGLSDTQMGMLTGIAFALFYATLGLPIARLADRKSRVVVIGIGLLAWSAMTALGGAARNFLELFASRVGVGAGEAGSIPASHSLIADYVPPARRSMAMAIFNTGGLLGMTGGLALAGWLAADHGWRVALAVLAVPGLVLVPLLWLTVREPIRRDGAGQPPLRALGAALLRTPAYPRIVAAAGVIGIATYGVAAWLPAFFMRSHGMSVAEVGAWYPLANGSGSLAGALLGGWLADRLARRDARATLWVSAGAYAAAVPLTLAALFVAATGPALVLVGFKAVASGMAVGPVIAAMIAPVADRSRATASAIYSFVVSLTGFGIGPVLIGGISDGLAPWVGSDSLRYALALAILFNGLGALLMLRAAREIEGRVDASAPIPP